MTKVSLRKFCQLFMDHVGINYPLPELCKNSLRIRLLTKALKDAERCRNLELITQIKSGKFRGVPSKRDPKHLGKKL